VRRPGDAEEAETEGTQGLREPIEPKPIPTPIPSQIQKLVSLGHKYLKG